MIRVKHAPASAPAQTIHFKSNLLKRPLQQTIVSQHHPHLSCSTDRDII
jgi:hypothetical protein